MRTLTSRRSAIQSLCGGLGSIGLAGMLTERSATAANVARPVGPDFPPKAKHVIILFMTGGPSHLEMFDPKPALLKYAGQRPAAVDLRTERVTGGLMPSSFAFKKQGKSGIEVSELLPHLGSVVDDLCVVRSMYTLNPTHPPARNLFCSGNISPVRPSIGSWISYGLGSENANLPGFIVLCPDPELATMWRAGFLPGEFQGTFMNDAETEPEKMIQYLRNTKMNAAQQRRQIDLIQSLNRDYSGAFGEDAFLDSRIRAMETAYRMQLEALDVFDLRKEPASIRADYGKTNFANGCLLARRLVEKGVRCVNVYYGHGQPWDDHKDINQRLAKRCPDMDQACAALIRDLKQRGLLDDTLVVWGGEFGRTPVSESGDGRDHNPFGYTMWMAGGGVKPGYVHGATDEFGFKAVEDRVSIHDLHASILYSMGVDHEKLTYRYAGRDFRLTDIDGQVARGLFA